MALTLREFFDQVEKMDLPDEKKRSIMDAASTLDSFSDFVMQKLQLNKAECDEFLKNWLAVKVKNFTDLKSGARNAYHLLAQSMGYDKAHAVSLAVEELMRGSE